MVDIESRIRAAIQNLLDSENEGWHLSQYVLALGLERVVDGNRMESIAYVWSPEEQPDWATDGLLQAALLIREDCDLTDD